MDQRDGPPAKEFEAAGDGVTDDSAAFQAAVDWATTTGRVATIQAIPFHEPSPAIKEIDDLIRTAQRMVLDITGIAAARGGHDR